MLIIVALCLEDCTLSTYPVLAQLQARCETSHALPGPKAPDARTHTRRQARVAKMDQKDDNFELEHPIWTDHQIPVRFLELDKSPAALGQ